MARSVLLVPVLMALAGGLAGCSGQLSGAALPSDTSSRPSSPPADETDTDTGDPSEDPGTGQAAGPLAVIAACDLLSAQSAAQLGVGAGEERTVGEARNCRWRVDGVTLADSFTLDLAIYDVRGIDDVAGSEITPVAIGSHDAVTSVDASGGCVVTIAVGESSRVDTLASGGDPQRGCELAMQLAFLVEPELP